MKSTTVDTVTSNETYVRMRVFDGDLQISEAGEELLRIERCQHEATRRRLREAQDRLAARDCK